MMGRTHVTVATAIYCTYTLPKTLEDLPMWGMGLGAVLLSSLLPDLDEPRSRIGGLLLPIIPSYLRPLAFTLIGAYLAYTGASNGIWWLLLVGLTLLFLVMIRHRESPTHALVGLGLVLSLTYSWKPELIVPVLIGYGSHLVLDIITEGISLLWPIPMRIRIPIMSTNSLLERWVVYRGSQVWILVMIIQVVNKEVLQPIQNFVHRFW
ncbi:inner membrane protein [Brevibacillus sp. IT-7CA2]|uniref:metal-dependent hydrolase n=1 Tax=Brevibacillus sp. IT-7CA2 TaxID=3026436 RepID=UPI0039DF6C85